MSKKFEFEEEKEKEDSRISVKPAENIFIAKEINRLREVLNGKVDNILEEGKDWSTEAELKLLLTKNDLVNISTLTKGIVTGVITKMDEANKITVLGSYAGANPVNDAFGGIEIEFEATGKIFLINVQTPYVTQDDANSIYSKLDLSNVNVGVANAGKLARVKADGGLEYVDEAVKNLTHLTTQDEIFNAVEINKLYLMETGEIVRPYQKSATSVSMSALVFLSGGQISSYFFRADKDNQKTLTKVVLQPTNYNDLTNKKYVDDAIAKLIADNGLTVSDEPEYEDDGPVDVGYLGRKIEKIKQANSKKKQKVSGDEPEIK